MAQPTSDLGSWLRSLRERSGLSQTELASAVGTDRRNIRRWELEGHDPGGSMLLQLLAALGVGLQPAPADELPSAVNAEVRQLKLQIRRLEDESARRQDELLARLDAQDAELRLLATRAESSSRRE